MATKSANNINEIVRQLYELSRQKQKESFLFLMDRIKNINTDANATKFPKDETFFTLNELKTYFFLHMDDEEKCSYVPMLIQYCYNKEFCYNAFETLSLFYKFVPLHLQDHVFNVFFEHYEELLKSYRGITTVSIFIKNTHKSYSEMHKLKIALVLDAMNEACEKNECRDTYYYTVNNCNRHFRRNSNADILLLIPEFSTATSFVQPPLCMLQVASLLQDRNISFDILDNRVYSYSTEQLLQFTIHYKFIAITSSPLDQVQTYFLDHRHTIFCNLVNSIKAANARQIIIVAGAHCTVRPDIVLNTTSADIILLGEYDIQLANVLHDLTVGADISEIPNIIERNGLEIRYHAENKLMMHPTLWTKCKIDFSTIRISDYYGYQYLGNTHLKRQNWAVMQTSRGCPYHCTFCYNFYTHEMRYKDISIIIEEMLQLESIGASEIFFIDQNFTINREYSRELCRRIINTGIHIDWTCETRIDLIDEHTLELMKDAGCKAIWFGIESFDEEVLVANKKESQATDYNYAINLLNRYEIDYRAFIMLGMKGETKESLSKTVDRIVAQRIRISKTIVKCKERFGTDLYDEIDISEKEKIHRFEHLGLRRECLSKEISPQDINLATKRLMRLNSQ